jgi:cell division transport system permease protein
MRFSQWEFAVQEAWKGFVRGKLMSLIAVFTITLILVIFGYFVLLLLNIHALTETIGSQLEISAYLSDKASDQQIQTMILQLKSQPGTNKVHFISREEAWQQFQKDFSGVNFNSINDENPLPHTLKIQVNHLYQIPAITSQLKANELVDDVQYGGELAERLQRLGQFINIAGSMLIGLLMIFVLFLVVNTIQMTVLARSSEIEIMQLVGATNMIIQIPFVMEGFMMSAIAAALASILIKISYSFLLYRIAAELPFFPLLLRPLEANAVFVGIFFLGLLLGGLGGLISVNRSLGQKRV